MGCFASTAEKKTYTMELCEVDENGKASDRWSPVEIKPPHPDALQHTELCYDGIYHGFKHDTLPCYPPTPGEGYKWTGSGWSSNKDGESFILGPYGVHTIPTIPGKRFARWRYNDPNDPFYKCKYYYSKKQQKSFFIVLSMKHINRFDVNLSSSSINKYGEPNMNGSGHDWDNWKALAELSSECRYEVCIDQENGKLYLLSAVTFEVFDLETEKYNLVISSKILKDGDEYGENDMNERDFMSIDVGDDNNDNAYNLTDEETKEPVKEEVEVPFEIEHDPALDTILKKTVFHFSRSCNKKTTFRADSSGMKIVDGICDEIKDDEEDKRQLLRVIPVPRMRRLYILYASRKRFDLFYKEIIDGVINNEIHKIELDDNDGLLKDWVNVPGID